ncbi:methyltransferase [Streptomyces avermitilis]|nr:MULTISPECIES: class I SAM-dependent methyltransferase [Streptomyces]KUN54410.1 methyltransferase [Streptomyces avermitilis]MYT01585.1 methyltransferase domain-containing protein [Streptomyces sp. SID5469]OOV28111.1 methyltransferase [Streptomyces avermitilis]GDY73527.1 methyltransferase type 12 [Streptomyces avermitilis]GDY82617.1 methyltransferase type 12 [Streptomyces avermitilis]
MPPTPQAIAARRAAYLGELAQGTDRFHEPRRENCPWCGSKRLRTRLRTPDLRQHKPGSFVVDECRDCAHTFQNPRLTTEGLAFYHRDFPEDPEGRDFPEDPEGREGPEGHERPGGFAERIVAARGSLPRALGFARAGRHLRRHRTAAHAMLSIPEPESWLDVGTGHGHFPESAREIHPYTAFDGLDPTPRVERARAAGRVEEAHRGHLTDPEIIQRLRARYDVVSMFHHLEHTPDPREELRAALAVLRPGGHLLIEGPDPACAFGRLLGKWWMPYGQPRRLHLMPLSNLLAELEARGCVIVRTDRREPHTPYDITGAVSLALARLLPAADAPWRATPPSELRRRLRTALLRVTTPLVVSAAALDHALAPLLSRTRFSNTYRIIARREE